MRKLLCVALIGVALPALAGDWMFTLKDLRSDGIYGSAGSLVSVSGSFSGTDANGDGFITTDELTNLFVWGDQQAYPFRTVGFDETPRPYVTGAASIRFEVASGQFQEFSARSFDGGTGYRMSLLGAFQCAQFCYGATFEQGTSSMVVDTKSFAQAAAVPEPETLGLMLLGLLTLSGTGWRRRATSCGS